MQLKLLQSLLLAMTCVLHFFLSFFFFSSQCKALGLSIWWRDQIYCSQILRFPAPTEGKDFLGCNKEGFNRENGGRFNFLNEQESSAVRAFVQDLFLYCILVPDDSLHCTALSVESLLNLIFFCSDDFFFFIGKSTPALISCSLGFSPGCGCLVWLLHCDDEDVSVQKQLFLMKNVNFIQGAELVHIVLFSPWAVCTQCTVSGEGGCTVVCHLCSFYNPIIPPIISTQC